MFPSWRHVETAGSWSGFVGLARNRLPYVGPIPGGKGAWVAMCYHGNGVAMGSYAGHLVALALIDGNAQRVPKLLRQQLARFPFGRLRRMLMPPLYAGLRYRDMF